MVHTLNSLNSQNKAIHSYLCFSPFAYCSPFIISMSNTEEEKNILLCCQSTLSFQWSGLELRAQFGIILCFFVTEYKTGKLLRSLLKSSTAYQIRNPSYL